MSEAEETRFPDRLITVCFVTALWNTQLLLSAPSTEREREREEKIATNEKI